MSLVKKTRKPASELPMMPAAPPLDIREEVRARMIAKANAEVPPELRTLTPAECRAKLREMGGFARMVNLREPGQDEDEAGHA